MQIFSSIVKKMFLNSFIIVFFVIFFFGFTFNVANAATATAGPFDISSLWGGVLGTGAEVQAISFDYQVNMTGDASLAIGESISFDLPPSSVSANPSYFVGGGNLSNRNGNGDWIPDVSDQNNCSASGPNYNNVGGEDFNFKLCGVNPSASIISSNSGVINCSGVSCTAVGAGSATITARVSSDLRIWGNSTIDGRSSWPSINADISDSQLTWSVTVFNPPSINFQAQNSPVAYNTPVTLTWGVVDADSCIGINGTPDWTGAKGTGSSNSFTSASGIISSQNFDLSCTGPGGTTNATTVTIDVLSQYDPPDLTLTATPNLVLSGETSTLTWTSSNVDSCITTDPFDTATADWLSFSPETSSPPSFTTNILTAEQSYWLQCSNSNGDTIETFTTVAIGTSLPPRPNMVFEEATGTYDIANGGSVTLRWKIIDDSLGNHNTNQCVATVAAGIDNGWPGPVTFLPSETFYTHNTPALTQTTAYTLQCDGDGGSRGKTVTINVQPLPVPDPTVDLKANGSDGPVSINYDADVNLSWTTTDAASCSASGDWAGSKNIANSSTETETISGVQANYTFNIQCVNSIGVTAQDSVTVNVGAAPVLSLTFTSQVGDVAYDGSTALDWNAVNALWCESSGGTGSDGWASSSKPTSGSNVSTGSLKINTTYLIICYGYAGQVTPPLPVTVAVDPPPIITVDLLVNGSASPVNVNYGDSVVLTWTSTNADYCQAYGDWIGAQNLNESSGVTIFNVQRDSTFELRCWIDTPYTTVSDFANVTVSNIPPVDITLWSAQSSSSNSPTDSSYPAIDAGRIHDSTYLHWIVKDAQSCVASSVGASWSGSKDPGDGVNDVYDYIDLGHGDDTYTLTCTNFEGISDSATYTVKVCADGTLSDTIGTVPYNGTSALRLCARYVYNDPGTYCLPTSGPQWWLDYGYTLGDPQGRLYPSECYNYINYPTPQLTSDTYFYVKCYRPGIEATCGALSSSYIGDGEWIYVMDLPTITFTAAPNPIDYGFSSVLTWTTTNADSCVASAGPNNWMTDSRWGGSTTDSGNFNTGPLFSDRTYEIECTGNGNTISGTVTVIVNAMPFIPPTITFWADPNPINYGETTTLYWTTVDAYACEGIGGSADWVSIPGSADKSNNGNQVVGPLDVTTTYTILCYGNGTETAIEIVIVGGYSSVTLDSFTAVPNEHNYPGGNSDLSWTSTGADWCLLEESSDSGINYNSVGVFGPDSNITRSVTQDMLYKIYCERDVDWEFDEGFAGVVVYDINPPQISNFTYSDAPSTISWDGSTLLQWNTQNTSDCNISGGWSGSVTSYPSGNQGLVNLTQTLDYTLTCNNANPTTPTVSQTIQIPVESAPLPTINFWADEVDLVFNGSTTLRWNVVNATDCNAGGNWSSYDPDPVSGTYNIGPLQAGKYYQLSCTGPGGGDSRDRSISVALPTDVPSVYFRIFNSINPILFNSETTLLWDATNADYCIGTAGPSGWTSGIKPISGSFDTGNLISDTQYEIKCFKNSLPLSPATASLAVFILPQIPEPMVIDIWADDFFLDPGESTNIYWNTTNALLCGSRNEVPFSLDDWVNGELDNLIGYNTGPLSATTIYAMNCVDDSDIWRTVAYTIFVGSSSYPDPEITLFMANPNPVDYGSGISMAWETNYATHCDRIDGSSGWTLLGSESDGSDGGLWISPTSLTISTIYTLRCYGPTGWVEQDLIVNVGLPGASEPDIQLLSSMYNVEYGDYTTLNWNVTNISPAGYCFGSSGPAEWMNPTLFSWGTLTSPGGLSGSFVTQNLQNNVQYQITCTDGGVSKSFTLTIEVRKLVVCPEPVIDTLYIDGSVYTGLNAWFIESIGNNTMECPDIPLEALRVTENANTNWIANNTLITLSGGGRDQYVNPESLPGTVNVTATYDWHPGQPLISDFTTFDISDTPPSCGDGIINRPPSFPEDEECDDGDNNSDVCPATCSTGCQENDCRRTTNWIEVAP